MRCARFPVAAEDSRRVAVMLTRLCMSIHPANDSFVGKPEGLKGEKGEQRRMWSM